MWCVWVIVGGREGGEGDEGGKDNEIPKGIRFTGLNMINIGLLYKFFTV